MRLRKNEKLIFIGDSLTDYGRSPEGEGLSQSDDWGQGYPSLVRGWLTAFYPEYRIRVINKGTSGHQTRDLLARWQEDVIGPRPDWVSILIGTNDVWRKYDAPLMTHRHVSFEEYEENMRRMIEQTFYVTKNMVLMTPFMLEPNRNDPMRADIDHLGTIIKRLSEQYGLVFVDLQTPFDRLLEHLHPMAVSWDRIHPGPVGRCVIAQAFLEAVEAVPPVRGGQ